ncbi:Dual oxidase maturation factor 1, partial [Aphelenchoides avenae]
MQMHEAWFSAFRDDFGPTSYGNGGHLAINFRLLICFLVFIVPYLAFIVVFPGIREKRLATFVTLTLHLTVGALLT